MQSRGWLADRQEVSRVNRTGAAVGRPQLRSCQLVAPTAYGWGQWRPASLLTAAHLAQVRHPAQEQSDDAVWSREDALQRLAHPPIGDLWALPYWDLKAELPVADPASGT